MWQRKKRHPHLNLYAKYEQKTVGLDMAKLNIFFMKPNNLTSLRRMSRVRLAWRGFLTILQSELNVLQGQRLHTLLHPYSAPSLILRALGLAVPPPLHSNMILKMHVKYWIICLLTQVH